MYVCVTFYLSIYFVHNKYYTTTTSTTLLQASISFSFS